MKGGLTEKEIAATAYMSRLIPPMAMNDLSGPVTKCETTYPSNTAATPYRIRMGSMTSPGPFQYHSWNWTMRLHPMAMTTTKMESNSP